MSDLIDRFLDLDNFELAWELVAENDGCAGVDWETIQKFGRQKDRYLPQLRQAVQADRYRPLPLRQLFIPKSNKGWRELRIPTVRDRIVQQALLRVLHPLIDPQFEESSFAYRPGRSHLMAVDQVAHWRDRGYEWVLDADIVQYFDSIEHPRLLEEIQEHLTEIRVLKLLRSWLEVGVLTKEGLILPQQGVAQGAVISPILANIYLDDFDEILSDTNLKLVRYADDFVVLSRSKSRIQQAHQEVAEILQDMGLELHPKKTQITNFDRGFRFLGHAFAGDVIVPVSKQKDPPVRPLSQDDGLRLVYAEIPDSPSTMQIALVEALKSSGQPIPPPLFVVLGYAVRKTKPMRIQSGEDLWHPEMTTLYLVKQGTVVRHLRQRFLIQPPEEPEVEVLIREIDRILIFGNIQLTTPVLGTCLDRQIPVIFLSQLGEYKGHLQNMAFTDISLQILQMERSQDQEFKQKIAQAIVWGKLWNSNQLLIRLNRKRKSNEVVKAIDHLRGLIKTVTAPGKLPAIGSLRGYEGTCASQYFNALGHLITNTGFSWQGRTHRPPQDPVNSLLSFGYSLLFENVLSLILAEGLSPYFGNLHGSERQQAYLAFDLMEEFRSPVVDTLVMKMINQKIVRPTDFEWPTDKGGIYLTQEARRLYLKNFEARMSLKTAYPSLKDPATFRRIIELQIRRYAQALKGEDQYEPYLRQK